MFSFSSGVAGVISLLYQHIGLLQELIFILDYFTTINNNYRHYYPYKFKKKRYKTEILALKLISKLLLFLVTMSTTTATHAIDATLLKGIILWFCPHFDASISTIHDSLNSVYGVDLYDNKFHSIFDDVGTNKQQELFKDAPQRLLAHMVDHIKLDHIKLVSGATNRASRSKTDKIDKLFGKMGISYQLTNGKVVNFQRGQDLATRIMHFIRTQRPDVLGKCMEILFLTSNIYPSLVVGAVDGLNMDELFSAK